MNVTNTRTPRSRAGTRTLLWACLALCILICGCDTGITKPDQVTFPDSNVSWEHNVRLLFSVSCTFSGCHNGIDRAGGVSLEEYIHLFSVPGLVHPGDSTGSLLWQVVTERLPHSAVLMPNLLSARQAHGIAVWIQEGARNN